jgi:hypothetical protein
MGVLADFLANSRTVDTTVPHEASDRVICRKVQGFMDSIGDSDYPADTEAARRRSVCSYFASVSGL